MIKIMRPTDRHTSDTETPMMIAFVLPFMDEEVTVGWRLWSLFAVSVCWPVSLFTFLFGLFPAFKVEVVYGVFVVPVPF